MFNVKLLNLDDNTIIDSIQNVKETELESAIKSLYKPIYGEDIDSCLSVTFSEYADADDVDDFINS